MYVRAYKCHKNSLSTSQQYKLRSNCAGIDPIQCRVLHSDLHLCKQCVLLSVASSHPCGFGRATHSSSKGLGSEGVSWLLFSAQRRRCIQQIVLLKLELELKFNPIEFRKGEDSVIRGGLDERPSIMCFDGQCPNSSEPLKYKHIEPPHLFPNIQQLFSRINPPFIMCVCSFLSDLSSGNCQQVVTRAPIVRSTGIPKKSVSVNCYYYIIHIILFFRRVLFLYNFRGIIMCMPITSNLGNDFLYFINVHTYVRSVQYNIICVKEKREFTFDTRVRPLTAERSPGKPRMKWSSFCDIS